MARFRYIGPRPPLAVGFRAGDSGVALRMFDLRDTKGPAKVVTPERADVLKADLERVGATREEAAEVCPETVPITASTIIEVPDDDKFMLKAMRMATSIRSDGRVVPQYEEIKR